MACESSQKEVVSNPSLELLLSFQKWKLWLSLSKVMKREKCRTFLKSLTAIICLENRMCFRKFIVKQGLTGQIMVNFKNQVSKFGIIYIRRDEFKDF